MFASALVAAALLAAAPAGATGRATCDSGPAKDWQASEILTRQLEAKGWKVRRVKVDGGCYEVYALDEKGQRVEVYFHPRTLEPVPAKPR
ncbi:MAG TPA: PepSY domain-containing protein [Burkholderiales bacterium]